MLLVGGSGVIRSHLDLVHDGSVALQLSLNKHTLMWQVAVSVNFAMVVVVFV